jgi:hypothetical protein
MASVTGSALKDFYKDLLQTSNSNSGLSTTIKQITCGDGDVTALSLSTRNVRIDPASDTTTTFLVRDTDGNSLVTVDSTNDLVKAGIGQHTVNTQFKSFGLWDFSPSAGEHHNLTTSPMITSASDGDFTGEVNGSAWGGTGTNPATSLTVASAALELVPSIWLLPVNITLDSIQYIMASDAASTINIHVMQYNLQTGTGSTAGDLSSGAVLAQTGSNSSSLSPVTTGADRISNGTLTINTADVDSGKAIVLFAEASDTDDMTVQVNIKYHLR